MSRRCCPPIYNYQEFDISGDLIFNDISDKVTIPLFPETDIDLLKNKVICEYLKIITEIERGNFPDLEFILEEISAIDLEKELGDKREFVIQYYLNNYE